METQPPTDISALARAIDGLAIQIAGMRADLSEVRRISCLTQITLKSYYNIDQSPKQEQHEGVANDMDESRSYQGKDKRSPPLVPEGTRVTCVRCDYEWSPRARRPHLCPRCKTPWWFPAKWKWSRKTGSMQESDNEGQ